MARLSRTERKVERAWLEQWRDPAAALARVAAINERMDTADFFGQSGTTFLRDAWTAATFAAARSAPAVRLLADTWPDAEVRSAADPLPCAVERLEIVEADMPDRRRAEEYRQWQEEVKADPIKKWRSDPMDKMIARADEIPRALTAAIERKLAKRYAGRASLLVLLNINEFGIRQETVVESFAAAAAPAVDQFERVWILWKDVAYGPWSAGDYSGRP